jgi:serine/threonine protein kinase
MGVYQGPGEEKTAQYLASNLPNSWYVIAGRKLSGPTRDDLDLVVVGERAVFVLDEKAWGPRIVLGDQIWRVKGEERRNPLDRTNHLARVLAGHFRERVSGYSAVVGSRKIVKGGIVLSHDTVEMVFDPGYDDGDAVVRRLDAPQWLLDHDAREKRGLEAIRVPLIEFLTGLPARDSTPDVIGTYRVLQEDTPIEMARCFFATDGDELVLLRCYPMNVWGSVPSAQNAIDRERLALKRLKERDRAWQIYPSYEYEARQWLVVPVVPPEGKSLRISLKKDDPARSGGRLPQQVAQDVVTDAFRGLAEVHEAELTHRGLDPGRIFLGRGLRVKFSDFYLARATGEQSITPGVSGDEDPSVSYRAPECRAALALARKESDTYSLALALSGWVLGELPAEPQADTIREKILEEPVIGPVLADCLASDYQERPSAAEAAHRIEQAAIAAAPAPPPVQQSADADDFREGGTVRGRFEIRRRLGEGGFAVSWLAFDPTTDADRVIKQFRDAATADTVRSEFKASERIHHDLCARAWDIGPGDPGYLVLEYVPGDNLRKFARESPVEPERYRSIALDMLEALAYLHGHNVVHRDVTPTNVIITPEGRAKLIDFGVTGPIQAMSIVGTPPFMAPEITARAGATPASDLYGFAVTMIHSILGRYPYAGDPSHDTDDREHLEFPTEDERKAWGPLGAALLGVLYKAAAANPADRPGSASELRSSIERIAEIAETPGEPLVNPTVDSIRRLYRASTLGNSGNRGLDDEFALATYVPTLLDTKLLPAILDGEKRLVLLTGNPGDGKTSFLVQVGERLLERGAEVLSRNDAGWRLRLHGHIYVAVYDASESHQGMSSDELMRAALDPAPGEDPERRTVLLAINDGRLLHFFTKYEDEYEEDAIEVGRQMDGKPAGDEGIALVDLKRRTLAPWVVGKPGLAGQILDTFTRTQRWEVCDGCLSRDICPMRQNAETLRGQSRETVEELVTTSYLRRQRRATFRDVRSALAWLITGDRSCEEVHAAREEGMDLRRGDNALVEDLAFDRRSPDYLIQEWADLDPAITAAPDAERAARADERIAPDPTLFTERDRERTQRQLYLGVWRPHGLGREVVRAYRHFARFNDVLLAGTDRHLTELRQCLLLGLSRLLGAPGYRGTDLAIAEQGADGTWAVLKEIPEDAFSLKPLRHDSPYVESRPDALVLRHAAGFSLVLTLDTLELVLRVADGDLIGDSAADSVRQEIEAFAAALRNSPAETVSIVNPAGTARRALVSDDRRIILERL